MSNYLIIPMFVHIAMTAFLYVLLTLARAPTIWNIGANQDGTNPFKYVEQRISANLSNQFEWPLFFYVACFFLISQEHFYSVAHLYLAWIFIFGRILHSCVHILTNNVRLRGVIFTINFLAVFSMWVLLLITYLTI